MRVAIIRSICGDYERASAVRESIGSVIKSISSATGVVEQHVKDPRRSLVS
jgi:hypothetical protein